ncbi:glycoside hydrolase family 43 protein [Mucilaginibacter lacusdianchii]|uniref:glycoside hydrolase family 43 protein n=1 Tax=Mucilaginibacter lacusdianchii TaxID=2684211 RepID=UPI00131AF698|nr:glycoside hydrolase family 43 protein [Mucilaginibacter sp. JXJ CY 39]
MELKENLSSDHLKFVTPDGAPFSYDITLANQNDVVQLNIVGRKIQSNEVLSAQYLIDLSSHDYYLNAFEQLSNDFGLRPPQNRKHVVPSTKKINYQEILLENKHKGMLYGYGDPAVLRTNQNDKPVYYLVATSNDAPDSFPLLSSENLADWTFLNYVFAQGQKPAWATQVEVGSDYWAPELHQIGDEYRLYFVARDKESKELCIGMATSKHPELDFVPNNEPVLKGNVIDPHIYIQDKQTVYLFWKEDNNDVWPSALIKLLYNNPSLITYLLNNPQDQATASFMVSVWPWLQHLAPMVRFMFIQVFIEAVISRFLDIYRSLEQLTESHAAIADDIRSVLHYMKTPIYAQQLSANGQVLVGERTKILENDLAWEAHLIEGMWVTQQHNRYYLFYAGNDFSTDQYGIGVAIADHPLGPYRKMPEPFLQSTARWTAPGHPSVTTSPDGKPVMFLHAYYPGQAGYKQFRALLAVGLKFEKDRVLWV